MKKKSLALVGLLSLFLINFVSAQLYDFGNFSLSGFLSSIDPSTVLLSILFVIFFAVLYFATSKMFKGNKAVPAVISIAVSLLIIYGINTATNVQNLLTGFGLSESTTYTIGSIFLIAFLIFIFVKLKSWAFILLGLGFIVLALTNLIYSSGLAFFIGAVLLIVGIVIRVKKNKNKPKP